MIPTTDTLPPSHGPFPVAVILERRPAKSAWVEDVWQAVAITVGHQAAADRPTKIHEQGDVAQYLVGGLEVSLHVDECESYYHNLMSDTPRAYVIAHLAEHSAPPVPFHISLSFDEAHAYLEGDDEIYAVDIPPELYRWTEAFVIAHYVAEKKRKRKLRDWTAEGQGPSAA